MAGAILKFSTHYMGVERCENPDDGKQFLQAVIYSGRRGVQTSAPVEIEAAEQFALDLMKQCVLARGYSEDDIITIGLEKIIDEIREKAA